MKTITIEGQLRTGFGKGATRQLRSQENVPGVIYGGAQEVSFYAPAAAFRPLVYTPKFQFAEVKLNGNTYNCILKDLQFDKVSDALIHVDLLELVEDKKVIAAIPLYFTGSAKGVKDGGKLHIKMKSLKVKTYPKYLREQIEINVDDLELNGSIRVEDVKIEHYEIMNSPRIPVASVSLTRELKQEEAAVPAATAAAPGAAVPAAGAAATPAAAAPTAEKGEKKEKGKK
ncbi:MAG: 50S ribosomal protein L25 [Chitinophagales bacterium]